MTASGYDDLEHHQRLEKRWPHPDRIESWPLAFVKPPDFHPFLSVETSSRSSKSEPEAARVPTNLEEGER